MAAHIKGRSRPAVGHPRHLGVRRLDARLAAAPVHFALPIVARGQVNGQHVEIALNVLEQVGTLKEKAVIGVCHDVHRVGDARVKREEMLFDDRRHLGDTVSVLLQQPCERDGTCHRAHAGQEVATRYEERSP